MNRVHAFTNDVLAEYDAVDLVDLISKKEVSRREVIQATMERAEKVNPAINAIVEKCYDQALKTVENSTQGFFSGIPMFYKDLTYIEGLKTFYGSQAFEDATPATFTDPIAQQIKAIGFTTLGTSTMPEFGFTCSTEYPHQDATHNPWNTKHSVGGSSGGAAALVAAGVVPIAHAADGGGSIRIPSAVCGLVGLKPTRGRVLLSKLFEKELVPISTDGVITRSVRDTAQFYFEAEKYYRNNQLLPIGLVNAPLNKSLKIGFIGEVNDELNSDKTTGKVLQETITLLQDLGHTLKPVQFPLTDHMVKDFKRYWGLNGFLLKRFGKRLFKPPFYPDRLTKFTNGLAQMYKKHIVQTPFVISRLKKSYYDYKAFLKENQIDILLTPTVAHLTPEIGHFSMNQPFEDLFAKMEKWAFFTPYSNACGCPSISLPLGHYTPQDLPIGMLFWANHGEEKLLLELALQIEAAKPWKQIQS